MRHTTYNMRIAERVDEAGEGWAAPPGRQLLGLRPGFVDGVEFFLPEGFALCFCIGLHAIEFERKCEEPFARLAL